MYKTLVISGGGIKGFGILGMLHKLAEDCLLSSVSSYVGSSVGGVIAALLCFGLSPIEIVFFFLDVLPVSYTADKDKVINKIKLVIKDTTFQQLYESTGKS